MEQMQFKISSALKDLVGKDLIINDNVAIFELVKNAYDAYAKKVVIEFLDDKIIIADNGKGMSLNDIKNKWLFLGYSAKKDGTEDDDSDEKQKSYRDKIRRHYAGAKGIGRFSCDRLGKELLLKTKSVSSNTLEIIQVNWTDFEIDQNLEFAKIDVGHDSLTTFDTIFPDNKTNGTILEISKLNDEKMPWTRKRLLDLKHSLEKLINPFAETNDFSIEIRCKSELAEDKRCIENEKHERELVNGVLKNSITSILNLKTTQIDLTLTKEYIYTTLSDRGVNMYEIREKNLLYDKLEDVRINLYYLNRSAKNNFTRLMGIEPVNYGSIFLFRNGFRIMPFGKTGDDSWGLDYRAQQGHSRFLGTRDLFGRVDVITDQVDELKEVSSRDGGLIETKTSQQLFKLFETAHRRLERYVMGVLWGGLFLQKEYFSSEEEAVAKRKELQDNDKDNDTPEYLLKSSLGSKIDFVQLIKSLARDKNVEIISYNKELANILSDQSEIENIKPQFINDLEKIAESTNDENMLLSIDEAKKHIRVLQKEKAAAEQRAIEAEKKREEAERRAQEAEERRRDAERKRQEEAEARRLAQIQAKEAELKRREEEIKRKEAEQRQKEEEERRKKAEKEKQIESLKVEFYKKASNPDTDALIHHVKNNNSRINDDIDKLIRTIATNYKETEYYEFIITTLSNIRKLSQKSLMATNLILNTDLSTSDSQKINLPLFIEGYLKNDVHDNIKCHFCSSVDRFAVIGSKLDLGLVLDNFIKNSLDWGAKNFWVICSNNNGRLIVDIYDDGLGLSNKFLNNPEEIFDFATSGKNDGTGFGMYLIRETLKDFKASIEVSEPIEHKGIHFKISFK